MTFLGKQTPIPIPFEVQSMEKRKKETKGPIWKRGGRENHTQTDADSEPQFDVLKVSDDQRETVGLRLFGKNSYL